MDSTAPCLDFAVIGHQDCWQHISNFINSIRTVEMGALSDETIKSIFSFIPPRDLFRVKVKSSTGKEINGVYIETFIDPDKLDNQNIRINLQKVTKAIAHAKKMGAGVVALGGFTSIILEGNIKEFTPGGSVFTTGNTLTAAYIVKGIEKVAAQQGINLLKSDVLIIGATGDIGMACTHYFKHAVKRLLLCARNNQRLQALAQQLHNENVQVNYAVDLQELISEADVIISVASSSGINLDNCKKNVLVCDAGYPKNLETKLKSKEEIYLFHGGMGQVNGGYHFYPDYSASLYRLAAPHIIHGCILEAMVLAFENRFEDFSSGKGNITTKKIEEIYGLSVKHGIDISPFYNSNGLWNEQTVLT
jgi:fatty aldehyde-generating acyl-ACP reductase